VRHAAIIARAHKAQTCCPEAGRPACKPRKKETAIRTTDHHSEYLAKTVAALTPDGRARVDELLEQLAAAGQSREWVVRFAQALEGEVDLATPDVSASEEPGRMLTGDELAVLTSGFKTIRDQEPLDDVADWANAVLALLEDER
jgi:hypothetical protein